MSRKRFEAMNCGIAQALEQVGDWWTLLIVRDAFFGLTRFSQFEESLGIAKNILTDRLHKLVEHEVFEKERLNEPGNRFDGDRLCPPPRLQRGGSSSTPTRQGRIRAFVA